MNPLPGLHTRTLGQHWLHLEQVDSTNNYTKTHAQTLPHGAVITASRQTAGKGRLGRQWEESPGAGLAMSVLLHGLPPEKMPLLPLLTGLAVSEGLEQLTGQHYPIKWSNDVLAGEKKLCGILCESRLRGSSGDAIIGIGVNLTQSTADFAHLGLVYATSLFLATGQHYTREQTAAALLNHLEPLLEEFQTSGFSAPLRDRYAQRCITLDRPVKVILGGIEQTGTAKNIAPDGALICTIEGKDLLIRAGEASVRGLYGYV